MLQAFCQICFCANRPEAKFCVGCGNTIIERRNAISNNAENLEPKIIGKIICPHCNQKIPKFSFMLRCDQCGQKLPFYLPPSAK